MVRNPQIQRKAQAELDEVLGQGVLPDFKDEASLPYITAILKETLRHSTLTPLGIHVLYLCIQAALLNST
jgi:cytochrome P450